MVMSTSIYLSIYLSRPYCGYCGFVSDYPRTQARYFRDGGYTKGQQVSLPSDR